MDCCVTYACDVRCPRWATQAVDRIFDVIDLHLEHAIFLRNIIFISERLANSYQSLVYIYFNLLDKI
jgi:hypothetical protein